MKYPPAPLTPFLAALLCIRRRMHTLNEQRELKGFDPLTLSTSISCALLNSLASLFASPLVCYQSFAASFFKTPGWGYSATPPRSPRLAAVAGLCIIIAVVGSVPRFQELTSCSLPPIDLHPARFHALMNCFFRNSRVFTNFCVAPWFFDFSRHSPLVTRHFPMLS
jgi:hypothetical protein